MALVLASVMALGSLVGTVGLAFKDQNNEVEPASDVPDALSARISTLGVIPWYARSFRTRRHELTCREPNCVRGARAYVVRAPEDPVVYLSTQAMMRTGYPIEYPVATVLVVSGAHSKYLLDVADTQRGGLRPLILANNALRNMGQSWATAESSGTEGRNITGNYAHSFVISNETDHIVLFGTQAYDSSPSGSPSFHRLVPGSKTLVWPDGPYYGNANRRWLAASLDPTFVYDQCASIAEALMYEILAPEAPTV